MEFNVSDEARKATKDCRKGFSCLAGEGADLCQVESCVRGEVHFVKCLDDRPCSYRVPFGDGHFCTCPTRKELFDKYDI